MRRWAGLLSLLAVAACSGLDEGEGGIVALELELPEFTTIEVGEQVQLVARALDAEGQVVDAPVGWRSSAAAVTVDAAGIATGAAPGQANVQATAGSLTSEALVFNVVAALDTLVIVGDSVVAIPVTDPPGSGSLTVRLETFTPPGPVGSRPVIFEITSPVPGTTPVVQLGGGLQSATVNTAADGTATATIAAVAGQIPPDTAIVTVRAEGLRGDAVPGSGQRFIVLFQ